MNSRVTGCLAVVLFLALAVSVILNLIFAGSLHSRHASITESDWEPEFQEIILSGAQHHDKIAVIDLVGLISNQVPGEMGDSMVDDVILKLKRARKEEEVKGVVLRIDSPGGEVLASDLLYREVALTRKEKPVVVYMESVAASGGYYAAMGSTFVMANELTITASIGVIMQTINYKDLLDKIGVKALTFKSGKMKDLLNPAREVTPEESKMVQDLINETYEKFVGIVAKERKLDLAALKTGLADGRILSGRQARDANLVDGLGYFEDATKKASELAHLEEAQIVRYVVPFHWDRFLRILGKSDIGRVQVQLAPNSLQLQSGHFYYLSPHLFGRE